MFPGIGGGTANAAGPGRLNEYARDGALALPGKNQLARKRAEQFEPADRN